MILKGDFFGIIHIHVPHCGTLWHTVEKIDTRLLSYLTYPYTDALLAAKVSEGPQNPLFV